MNTAFFTEEEQIATQKFLEQGYLVFPLENLSGLQKIRNRLYQAGIDWLKLDNPPSESEFFDETYNYISVNDLNDFRVKLIASLAEDKTLNSLVYSLGKTHLNWLVGNELAMQRSCNLSIQLPKDDSSLLPVHSDVWSGNSPYEVVFWLPLVDCYQSKSMFILPRPISDQVYQNFKDYSQLTAEEFYQAIEKDLVWLNVPQGNGAIFSHVLPHGNRINQEKTTRWTINVRFKSLFSPYGTKGLGESFLPITLRPLTRLGMSYIKPEC